jgi:hypothetical protein
MRVDGRTDMTKQIVAFRNTANAPKRKITLNLVNNLCYAHLKYFFTNTKHIMYCTTLLELADVTIIKLINIPQCHRMSLMDFVVSTPGCDETSFWRWHIFNYKVNKKQPNLVSNSTARYEHIRINGHIATHIYVLGTRQCQVFRFLPQPLQPNAGSPHWPLDTSLGWPQSQSSTVKKRRISYDENRTPILRLSRPYCGWGAASLYHCWITE